MAKKKRKKSKTALRIAGALGFAAVGLAANYLYNIALKRGHRRIAAIENTGWTESSRGEEIAKPAGVSEFDMGNPTLEDWKTYREETAKWLSENSGDVYLVSRDGLRLRALKVRNNSGKYVVICHGYMGSALQMSGFAWQFYKRGFNLLIPDARGHGESEGDYIGMGWPERLDIIEWTDLILRENAFAKIILFGVSMGGATVMMTAGETLPEQVRLVIEDCGYSSVWDQFSHNLREIYHLPQFPVMHASSALSKVRAGYGFREASAIEQLKKCKVPVLFIHGDKDDFVPFEMQKILYDSAAGEKELFVAEGAGHAEASTVNPPLYWRKIDAFLEKYGV